MARNPTVQLRGFVDKIRSTLGDAVSQDAMRPLAEQAIAIIVKRTRLGYGVPSDSNGTAERFDLKELAPSTIKRRGQPSAKLSDLTTPGRSNLTQTGQMLDSMDVISVSQANATIGPTGGRAKSSVSNAEVAAFVAAAGRPFLALSRLEYAQLVRFYRNTFGDLLKNKRLS